ncbi:MAG: hypothetical protein MR431_01620 [Clostridia bacterium]|nr:hypothetical protein [Clostridia bacterium]
MKDERLVRAVGLLDDDLLEEALAAPRRVIPWKRICAAAACLLLAAVLWTGPLSADRVTLGGTELGGSPAALSQEDGIAPMRLRPEEEVTLTLDLSLPREGTVTADVGTLALSKNGEVFARGQSCSARGDFSLTWTVETAIPGETYTLTVRDQSYLLAYDSALLSWTITKQQGE